MVWAVLAVLIGKETKSAVAREYRCDRRSVRRWIDWVRSLVEAAVLRRLVARLDPDGLPPFSARAGSGVGNQDAAVVVAAYFEQLAGILAHAGVRLPAARSGLARVLLHQHRRLGEIALLTRPLSPPLPMARSPAVG